MTKYFHVTRATSVGVLAALLSGGAASAAENISADIGISENTHFISYGLDVWGGKDDFFGDKSTTWIYGDFALKLNDWLAFNLSVWSDNNDNVSSGIGGHIQEIDINPGFAVTYGMLTSSVTYNAWSYAGDVEESIDFGFAYNDTGLIMEGFALNPKVVWHYRASGNGTQTIGSAVVLSVGPSFPLVSTLSLSIPAGIAFFTTDDFQGGISGGYGFSYIGASLNYGLEMIPEQYGKWNLNFGLMEYFTEHDAIPGNPTENFLTGSIGISVAY